MMNKLPERVYLDHDTEPGHGMSLRCYENPKYCIEPHVEYIRRDVHEQLMKIEAKERDEALLEKAAARMDAAKAALGLLLDEAYQAGQKANEETTNYNDGRWHDWHGSYNPDFEIAQIELDMVGKDSPVHPQSEVEIVNYAGIVSRAPAGYFIWLEGITGIVRFRVIDEHKTQPREWWVNVYPSGPSSLMSDTREGADRIATPKRTGHIKVREILGDG